MVKVLKGIDLRQFGSGSTGATNVWRAAGKWAGISTFAIDVLKGYVPCAVAHWLSTGMLSDQWNSSPFPVPGLIPPLVAVAALVGHSKSVWLNFQGGKSAATGLGTLIGLCPPGGGMTFVVWLTILGVFRYVSVASIIGVFSCPFWFYLFHAPIPYVIYCVFGFIWVTSRHKANLQRLFKGTEPKIGQKKDSTGALMTGEPAQEPQKNKQSASEAPKE
jgi:glycerol-3-phosphate acyltransferase PlsY